MRLMKRWRKPLLPETKVLILLCLIAALAWIVLIVITLSRGTDAARNTNPCEIYADRPGLEAVEGENANGGTYCYVWNGSRPVRVIQ